MGIKTYAKGIFTYTFAFGKWRNTFDSNNTSRMESCLYYLSGVNSDWIFVLLFALFDIVYH